MNGPAGLLLAAALITCAPSTAAAQVNYRPTPAPIVTAEGEQWYLDGSPVMVDGLVYFQAGAKEHFNPYEMVRSGSFRGIPIYVRPMLQTGSVVYVPLAGGLMQPYERRRTGELAGTTGSTAPSFPVDVATERTFDAARLDVVTESEPLPPPVGTAGATPAPAVATPVARPRPPSPANGIFIRFRGERWYSQGTPIPFDASRMRRIGEHEGLPLYASTRGDTLFVPVVRNADVVARYRRR